MLVLWKGRQTIRGIELAGRIRLDSSEEQGRRGHASSRIRGGVSPQQGGSSAARRPQSRLLKNALPAQACAQRRMERSRCKRGAKRVKPVAAGRTCARC
jgi:hypothetical protein